MTWRVAFPSILMFVLACHPAWEGDGDHDTFVRPATSSTASASPAADSEDRDGIPAEKPPELENLALESVSAEEMPSRTNAIPPKPPVDLSTVLICLERTECLGRCPNYRVMISGDGRVRYLGRSFVREIGDREGLVSEASIRELMEKFDRARFFDLSYSYKEHVTDLSSTIISVRAGSEQNHVENYWMGDEVDRVVENRQIHRDLDALAAAIDDAVRIEHWIGTEEERKQLFEDRPSGHPGAR